MRTVTCPCKRYPFLALALLAITYLFTVQSRAAELYVDTASARPWNQLNLIDRLWALTGDGVRVYIGGPIVPGDFNVLQEIERLVPIHTLYISSPGGSVIEALRIADFAQTYFIRVTTDYDWQCGKKRHGYPDDKQCGCSSACALIWLLAPARTGNFVRIHRPYFKDEFGQLPDQAAIKKYESSTSQVRTQLEAAGYSKDFVNRMFNTPRERLFTLSRKEIGDLPVSTPLDELTSSRCYADKEKALASYHDLKTLSAELARKIDELRSQFPGDVIIGDLLKDKFFGPVVSEYLATYKKKDTVDAEIRKLDSTYLDFVSCKEKARKQISLGKRSTLLDSTTRQELAELARELRLRSNLESLAPKGTNIQKLIDTFGADVAPLIKKLKEKLPARHWDYVFTEAPQSRP